MHCRLRGKRLKTMWTKIVKISTSELGTEVKGNLEDLEEERSSNVIYLLMKRSILIFQRKRVKTTLTLTLTLISAHSAPKNWN